MGDITNRLKKAKRDRDGKMLLSRGMYNKVKALQRQKPALPSQKSLNRRLKKELEKLGYEDIRIASGVPFEMKKEGKTYDRDGIESVLKELAASYDKTVKLESD